jgi:hypothetical protein
MTADTPARLRETLVYKPDGSLSGGVKFISASLIAEAADCIEQMEEALKEIATREAYSPGEEAMVAIARSALEHGRAG